MLLSKDDLLNKITNKLLNKNDDTLLDKNDISVILSDDSDNSSDNNSFDLLG